ncbi:hypothetical protein [Rhizobium sp. NFR07]|uniref:hypothetical protein n=1 Tax=Rhizobium sp. NFR07 TaxID=1566262 RepID=UPI0015A61249|nr:hypothetical protein [Rhizobium sp. NFR07]
MNTTETELARIKEFASSHQMSVSGFMRMASLERAQVRPFFSEDDLLIIAHLMSEIKNSGLDIGDDIRALNKGIPGAKEALRNDIVTMERALGDLCQELSGCLIASRSKVRAPRNAKR